MGIIIEPTPHKVVTRINWVNACKALRLVLGIKCAIKVCKYSILEKIKPTPMPTPPPYGRKIMWCFFLGQGWAGFSYWIFLHSKYTTGNITLSHSLSYGRKGLAQEGPRVTKLLSPPQPWRLRAASAQALPILHLFLSFFPSLPPHFKPWEKNEEKHTNQEGFSLHCVFQLDLNRRAINSALSHPPSSLLLSCPLCFVSFSVCVFRLRKKQLPPSSRRRQETSVASSKHNMIVTGPHGPWHLERPRSRGSRSDSLRNSSAWPLLSWTRLGCKESHRKPKTPLWPRTLWSSPHPQARSVHSKFEETGPVGLGVHEDEEGIHLFHFQSSLVGFCFFPTGWLQIGRTFKATNFHVPSPH